jgi:hypothetical protein
MDSMWTHPVVSIGAIPRADHLASAAEPQPSETALTVWATNTLLSASTSPVASSFVKDGRLSRSLLPGIERA